MNSNLHSIASCVRIVQHKRPSAFFLNFPLVAARLKRHNFSFTRDHVTPGHAQALAPRSDTRSAAGKLFTAGEVRKRRSNFFEALVR